MKTVLIVIVVVILGYFVVKSMGPKPASNEIQGMTEQEMKIQEESFIKTESSIPPPRQDNTQSDVQMESGVMVQ